MKSFRYVLEALLVYALYGFFRLLPLAWASAIAGKIARWLGPLLPTHRIAQHNFSLALPEYSVAEREVILAEMWENLGRVVGEFPHVAWLSDAAFDRLVEAVGVSHLDVIRENPHGGILISGHFANWEIAPKSAARFGLPLALIHRPANNPWVDRLIQRHRTQYQTHDLPKGMRGARGAMSALKAGEALGMLLDQKMNDGVAIPFFGKEAMTAPAAMQLALKYSSPLVLARVVRLKGARFRLEIFPAFTLESSGDTEADIRAALFSIHQEFERWIREHPSQWFWVHQRWGKVQKG